jgi:hypothetical protein
VTVVVRVRAEDDDWGDSARVQAAATIVIREMVCTCGQWCSSVRWSELMVEVDCGAQSR